MSWLASVYQVLLCDLRLLRRYPKLRFSVLGILFVPSLYALIYISSMWNPEANAPNLPVAIVNLDQGTQFKGEVIEVGRTLTEKLKAEQKLGFQELHDEALARQGVRQGRFDFALIIPQNFSTQAVRAERSGAGQLLVYTSEGNNYTGASVAKKFAPEITRRLNELLNEKRWGRVSDIALDSKEKVARLKEGVMALNQGAQQLRDGLVKANEGSHQLNKGLGKADEAGRQIQTGAGQLKDGGLRLTEGMKQLGAGIQTMNDKLPSADDLQRLRSGAQTLNEGQKSLNAGLVQLQDGSVRLTAGVRELKEKSADIPIWGKRVADGAGQIEAGTVKLNEGLIRASSGSAQLVQGSGQLADGVQRLTEGMDKMGAGVRQMHQKMPAATDLDRYGAGLVKLDAGTAQLSQGLGQLNSGSQRLDAGLDALEEGAGKLAAGLQTLDEAVPMTLDIPVIDAAGFSSSVKTEVEIAAPVLNNGSAFASNFIPLSLWVGAVMTAFLFHYRKLPVTVQGHGAWAKSVGKMFIPSAIVLAQVMVMLITVRVVMGIEVNHPALLVLTLLTSSIIFVSIVMALVRWLGDTGKVMAVLFLILQLSSSGAIVPIQLSGEVFQFLHPYLPFTWVVKATKVAMFDAYDGQWLAMYAQMLITPLILWPLSTYTGRWIYQAEADYMPALDVVQ